ncbi:penicillin acylase family protein [Paucibacter sp. Y2R2-4]|uniref:penicillin acylase family protein n=1 Tax=Paucibacter sp. Y2R2-4 TaxID=2893553 RepID=UPI0021E40F1C|nr:penicillin acylase family protein [Paucibacter sp. Y2R2-4]MCV2349639.1 penicillin acylase family protein [Paucibacter sp. Y2R2-4]
MNSHASPIRRWVKRLFLGLVALLVLLLLTIWLLMRASLPQLDGKLTLPGLQAPLSLQRDSLGTAVLQAQTRPDLARGIGYLHAQERFFEMDLTRRSAAGELSALFGEKALPRDKGRRQHRLRARLSERFKQLPQVDQDLLQAYADGVNTGLQTLRLRPWQYLILQAEPQAWSPVDSLLVVGEMFWMLQGQSFETGFELARFRERSGDALFNWLNPRGGSWDAALDGSTLPSAPLPSAEQLDLRTKPGSSQAMRAPRPGLSLSDEAGLVGSNNWAVAGSRSKNGRAILADDMHLGLGVPSIWYRAQFELKVPESRRQLRAAGLSLPGMPGLVVGSNGHVAWGFTNAYGQWFDWIKLPQDLAPLRASGRLQSHQELIAVKGKVAQALTVEEFDGSPLLREHEGQHYALRWIAHQAEAYNLELDRMMQAKDIKLALHTAALSGIPHQNILVADAQGQIGWSLAGRIWAQRSLDSSYARFQSTDLPAASWLAPKDYPKILNPKDGLLWTANNRQLGGEQAALIGDGGFGFGARAQQIRDRLAEQPLHDQASIAALHFDYEARFIKSWSQRISQVTQASPAHAEVQRILQQWNGRADADQVGYRLARAVRLRMLDTLWAAWTTPLLGAQQGDEKLRFKWQAHFEYSATQALEQRAAHLLPAGYASWDALLLAQVDAAVKELTREGKQPLTQATWGQHNASRIQHVMSKAIPPLSWLLDMPSLPQSGDSNLPHVAHPAFGQSQRMVVSPGLEEEALMAMPGGQSGHPLSPYYGAGHAEWAAGKPTALLAGPARHQLDAKPADPAR